MKSHENHLHIISDCAVYHQAKWFHRSVYRERDALIFRLQPYNWMANPPIIGSFYQHGVILIPAWMTNHMPGIVWDEINIYSQTSTMQPLKFVNG